MTAHECLALAKSHGTHYQLIINSFIDDFRRVDAESQRQLVADPIEEPGNLEGLIAATVSALCREADITAPDWVQDIYSPSPFFAFPARSFALRIRLMLESPAPFKIRNVFVPENYLSRA